MVLEVSASLHSGKCKSYLEVQEVIPLCQEAPPTSQLEPPPTSCIQPPPLIDPHPALSVSALQQSLRCAMAFKYLDYLHPCFNSRYYNLFRNKDSKRLDVHGKIAAVGEILRQVDCRMLHSGAPLKGHP